MEHLVTRIRNQHGPDATCGFAGCGRAVHFDVMADCWIHNMTAAEAVIANRRAAEGLNALMTDLAKQLAPLSDADIRWPR